MAFVSEISALEYYTQLAEANYWTWEKPLLWLEWYECTETTKTRPVERVKWLHNEACELRLRLGSHEKCSDTLMTSVARGDCEPKFGSEKEGQLLGYKENLETSQGDLLRETQTLQETKEKLGKGKLSAYSVPSQRSESNPRNWPSVPREVHPSIR